MRLLALETSEYVSSIALWEDGQVRAESFPSRMDLCEKLTARVQELLGVPTAREAGLDAIAVSQGPGSFTGLRVGMATAKALAHVLEVPLVGVPTQEAIAAAAEVEPGTRLLVLQQARRGHVYAGLWARDPDGATELAAPQVVPVEELVERLDGVRLITGPATEALSEAMAELPAGTIVRQAHAQASAVARLAAGRVGCAARDAAYTLQPLYLLASQAERMQNLDVTGSPTSTARPKRRQVRVRRAVMDDLPEVVRIENVSFSSPWSEQSLREELAGKPGSLFLVVELDGSIAGYIGAWLFAGEAHICTIAVDPAHRRCGLGEWLLLTLLSEARQQGTSYVILEYRVSNHGAAELYRKLGFDYVHRRRGYYQDTDEDAIVAAIPDLEAPEQQARVQQAEARWRERFDYELSLEV